MGLTCIHGSMTRSVLKDYNFNPLAGDFVAGSNEAVDDKQGNTSDETNLHAMCGFDDGVMQTEEKCRKAVKAILDSGEAGVVEKIRKSQFKEALEQLGQVLHTLQDLAYHKFEPWPYRGISDALLHDPNYMICHAVRDVGYMSRLEPSEFFQGRVDLEATIRPSPTNARNLYISGRVFSDQLWHGIASSPDQGSPLAARPPAFDDRLRGSGFMISITIGAAPRTLSNTSSTRPHERLGADHKTITECSAEGVESQARARDATADLMERIRRKVVSGGDGGETAWQQLLSCNDFAEKAEH